jgi:hypothetical protein
MKHERTRTLYEYWDEVRAGRRAPRRLEIEPGAISALLPYVFILERLAPISYRFRLAGTHVCAYTGGELRDRSFTALWPREEREAMESLLFSVCEDAAGACVGFNGHARGERSAAFEMVLLPLMTRTGVYDRVLGAISALESPYWIGNWPISRFETKSVRLLWPEGEPRSLAEERSPAGHMRVATSDGQHRLTVIDGGRPPGAG